MASSDVNVLMVELLKFKKNELIDLLMFKKVPTHLQENLVIRNLVEKCYVLGESAVESDKFYEASSEMANGGICPRITCVENRCAVQHLKEQIQLSSKVITQMEKTISSQDITISLLRSSSNYTQPLNKGITPSIENTTKSSIESTNMEVTDMIAGSAAKKRISSDRPAIGRGSDSCNGGNKRGPLSTVQNNMTVQSKVNKHTTAVIRGTAGGVSGDILGAEETVWLHVGRVKGSIEVDTMQNYLKRSWPQLDIICYKLQCRGTNSSFRIGIKKGCESEVLCEARWPSGVTIKEYRFFPKKSTVVQQT